MKKLSSMLALSLALAMVLGMTAFAKGPSSETDVTVESQTDGVEAEVVTDSEEELENLMDEDEYDALMDKVYNEVPKGADEDAIAEFIAVFDLSGKVPKDGKVTLKTDAITLDDFEDYVFYAYHYNKDSGEWEALPVTAGKKDGYIVISGITGFSNFVIYAYDKATEEEPEDEKPDNPGDNNNGNNSGSTTTDPATSPKTGETAPVAMMIVLVSLAGASVLGVKRVFSAR